MNNCKHEWYALASECALCGKPIEEHIAELQAQEERRLGKYMAALDLINELQAQVERLQSEIISERESIESWRAQVEKLENARTNDANMMLSLRRRLVRAENIPQKEKEQDASPYQKGWIAGWNGFHDELEAAIKE